MSKFPALRIKFKIFATKKFWRNFFMYYIVLFSMSIVMIFYVVSQAAIFSNRLGNLILHGKDMYDINEESSVDMGFDIID